MPDTITRIPLFLIPSPNGLTLEVCFPNGGSATFSSDHYDYFPDAHIKDQQAALSDLFAVARIESHAHNPTFMAAITTVLEEAGHVPFCITTADAADVFAWGASPGQALLAYLESRHHDQSMHRSMVLSHFEATDDDAEAVVDWSAGCEPRFVRYQCFRNED